MTSPLPSAAVRRTGARRLIRPLALSGLAALALAGCEVIPQPEPDPTRYFVLRSSQPATPATADREGVALGLHSVELPAYLRNSRSLVVARGGNELVFRDYDRWAEPLDAGLERVLRDALAAHPRVARVDPFPFTSGAARDYDLTVRVIRCEGAETADGQLVARLVVAYELRRAGAAGERVREGRFAAPELPWDGEAASLAARLAEAAEAAAAAIADELP